MASVSIRRPFPGSASQSTRTAASGRTRPTNEPFHPYPTGVAEASARFLPLLGTAFDRLHPWDRMLYVHQASGTPPRVPRGVTVRRLRPEDGPALAEADPSMGWIPATWGGPSGLAASGQGWAAFRKGRVLALACTRFAGSRCEDVACATDPSERRQHLALACVRGLTDDITARGRTATWSGSRAHRASRLLAWTAGFRLLREYVHHTTGPMAVSGPSILRAAA
ncbi:GNAT family N-acetyltransferase [Streptomyces sp. NPDC021012]|uniref:GNAT family N-acetyltransferase n=1 Tax=Streptomyces sp. NPDC021012 TaxID=3365107 RepID=UPI0037A0D4FF